MGFYFCRSKGLKQRPLSGLLNKQQQQQTWGAGGVNKHGKADKSERSRHLRSLAPYHRRSISSQMAPDSDLNLALPRNSKLSSVCSSTAPTMVNNGAASTSGIPHLQNNVSTSGGSGGGGGIPADSPHSAAPSPLMASQSQPSISQNGDPTMPTLSPHPPPKNAERDAAGSESKPALQNVATSAGVGRTNNNGSAAVPILPAAVATGKLSTERQISPAAVETSVRVECTNEWVDQQHQKLANGRLNLKRPILPPLFDGEDEEELVTKSFYEYPLDTMLVYLVTR